jgi:hypothetical protein
VAAAAAVWRQRRWRNGSVVRPPWARSRPTGPRRRRLCPVDADRVSSGNASSGGGGNASSGVAARAAAAAVAAVAAVPVVAAAALAVGSHSRPPPATTPQPSTPPVDATVDQSLTDALAVSSQLYSCAAAQCGRRRWHRCVRTVRCDGLVVRPPWARLRPTGRRRRRPSTSTECHGPRGAVSCVRSLGACADAIYAVLALGGATQWQWRSVRITVVRF